MENQNKNLEEKEKFVDKSVHQTYHDGKPVGYGSSIQSSGNGNRTRPEEPKESNPDLEQSEKEE